MKNNQPTFKIIIEGIENENERRNVQCSLQDTLNKLNYKCNYENFKVIFK